MLNFCIKGILKEERGSCSPPNEQINLSRKDVPRVDYVNVRKLALQLVFMVCSPVLSVKVSLFFLL